MLAVYDGADFLPVSKPHYITNLQVVAKNQEAFTTTKKGLNEIDMPR